MLSIRLSSTVLLSFLVGNLVLAKDGDMPCIAGCECRSNTIKCDGKGLKSVPQPLNGLPYQDYVRVLDLNNNDIDRISQADFKAWSFLEYIYINNNGLSSVEPGTFFFMKNLKVLDLSRNALSSLPSDTLPPSVHMSILNISFNPKLDIPGDLLHNLRRLDYFSAQNCSISKLNYGLIGKKNIRDLRMSANKVTVLPEELKDVFNKMTVIELDSNPLHCNCEMAWFHAFASNSRRFGTLGETVCVTPQRLTNRAIRTLNPSDLVCRAPQVQNVRIVRVFPANNSVMIECTGSGDPRPNITLKASQSDESGQRVMSTTTKYLYEVSSLFVVSFAARRTKTDQKKLLQKQGVTTSGFLDFTCTALTPHGADTVSMTTPVLSSNTIPVVAPLDCPKPTLPDIEVLQADGPSFDPSQQRRSTLLEKNDAKPTEDALLESLKFDEAGWVGAGLTTELLIAIVICTVLVTSVLVIGLTFVCRGICRAVGPGIDEDQKRASRMSLAVRGSRYSLARSQHSADRLHFHEDGDIPLSPGRHSSRSRNPSIRTPAMLTRNGTMVSRRSNRHRPSSGYESSPLTATHGSNRRLHHNQELDHHQNGSPARSIDHSPTPLISHYATRLRHLSSHGPIGGGSTTSSSESGHPILLPPMASATLFETLDHRIGARYGQISDRDSIRSSNTGSATQQTEAMTSISSNGAAPTSSLVSPPSQWSNHAPQHEQLQQNTPFSPQDNV